MKKFYFVVFTIVFLTFTRVLFPQESQWKKVYNDKTDTFTMEIFTRNIPGSPYKEFKGITHSDIPFDIALKVIQDYANYHKWYGMCNALYPITIRDTKDLDMYFVLDLPVVTDRDVVVKVECGWNEQKGSAWVTMKSINSDYKKDSGLVRMTSLKGRWDIKKIDDSHVEVVYQVHAELGGALPVWIVNLAAVDQPKKTLKGVYNYSKRIRDAKK